MELFQIFEAGFIKEKRSRKERGKDETLFEVDTFITAMCIEERDGMLYVFTANRLSRGLYLVITIEITAEKLQMPVELKVTNLKLITELRK
jgi:uncharacterized protein (DUF2126 family)